MRGCVATVGDLQIPVSRLLDNLRASNPKTALENAALVYIAAHYVPTAETPPDLLEADGKDDPDSWMVDDDK